MELLSSDDLTNQEKESPSRGEVGGGQVSDTVPETERLILLICDLKGVGGLIFQKNSLKMAVNH